MDKLKISEIAFVNGSPYWVREIHEGGMGVVYLLEETEAKHSLVLRKHLAAKTFKPGFETSKIRKELQSWIKLHHPNILPLLAIGDINDCLAALSPWRVNGTLADHMCGPVPPFETANILSQLINALDYSWNEHRIIHLDLKPNNIFLGKSTGQFELGDWGISSISSISQIQSSQIKTKYEGGGTLPYMGPERFSSSYQPVIQSDIYSIGIIALQLITAQLPFLQKDNIVEVIVSGEYVRRAKELSRNLTTDWRSFIDLTTAYDLRRRPSTYQEVLNLMRRLQGKQ